MSLSAGLVPVVVVCCSNLWLYPDTVTQWGLGNFGRYCGPPDTYLGIQRHVCSSKQHCDMAGGYLIFLGQGASVVLLSVFC
jgi:hypothetical protein